MNTEPMELIADLQIRITHQEAAIEELTRERVNMEKRLRELEHQLRTVQDTLRALSPMLMAKAEDEPPPPHY
jgi:SlyX protein